ncbi:DUF7311 family protein [Halorussus marinus]|uniref:DUF7311 family protein n=1 Tax=Halorussus marinus TaxID=2505976 RepID=UPI001092C584|nr:hypothetical protein [Halorussus marinus]
MIRTMLSVTLAATLAAAAAPAVDDARTARTERLVDGELDRIEAAAERLVREESPAPPGAQGPRRALTVSFPSGSATAVPVASVALGSRLDGAAAEPPSNAETDANGVVAATVAGGRRRVRRIGVELRPAESVADGDATADPLLLRAGTHRLVLRLVNLDDRPVVLVTLASRDGSSLPDGRPPRSRDGGSAPK